MERNLRKERIGVVVSNKMDKSIVVDHNTYSFLTKISFHENSIFSSVTLSQQG